MSGAYYSEFDPKAAAWLRELIKQGHIADGIVDERDLWDVSPTDLKGFTQVHLCAGIGVWSYALRRSGWEDSTECWTASFPCQPFSAAGKGKGFADERHLWPAGHFLIEECRPPVVFGEQVASKDGLNWLDLVQADLEGSGYACGAVDLCAAGLGAPHIRQRLYWTAERMADAAGSGQQGQGWGGEAQGQRAPERGLQDGLVGLEHAPSDGRIERRAEPSGRGFASGRGDGGLGHAGYDHDAGQEPTPGAGQPQADRPADQPGGSGVSPSGLDDPKSERPGFFNPENVGTTDAQERERGGDAHRHAVAIGGVADASEPGREPRRRAADESDGRGASRVELGRLRDAERVADAEVWREPYQPQRNEPDLESRSAIEFSPDNGADSGASGRAHSPRSGASRAFGQETDGAGRYVGRPGPTNGLWRDADWLFCRDGKWRAVEARPQQMVDGSAYGVGRGGDLSPEQSAQSEIGFPLGKNSEARVARLRGYGNAIVAPVAQAFIEAYLDVCNAACAGEGEENAPAA